MAEPNLATDLADAEEDELEEADEMVEADVIAMLDAEEDPQRRCQRAIRLSGGEPPVIKSLYSEGLFLRRATCDIAAGHVVVPAAQKAAAAGRLQPGGATGQDAEVRGDLMVMLDDASLSELGLDPALKVFEELRHELERHMTFREGAASCEFQLAMFSPGGKGYERHRDGLPSSGAAEPPLDEGGVGPQRLVTAILYGCQVSSDVEWRGDVHGGRLRAWPSKEAKHAMEQAADGSPFSKEGSDMLLIAPVGLVVFLSGALDHEVEPVSEAAALFGCTRAALTCWFS